MARKVNDAAFDGMLADHSTMTFLSVCAGEPMDPSQIAGLTLAQSPLVPGDFTITDGPISGRQSTVSAKNDLDITSSGTADHVVYHDGGGAGNKMFVHTCNPLVLTAGGTVNVPTAAYGINDPAP